MHQSVATIDSPQFINLQPTDINPLISQCEIKVLYVGKNRNRSFITKEVATEMSKTLRGAPIVGYYKKDKEDFAGHGENMIIDDEGIHFDCLTQPYGFVSPDAEVWFQKFEDKDDFGNSIEREYLMTTGYLWTGQFEECQRVLECGNNQSMELDEKTLDGYWSQDIQNNMEFFIINDAIFSKLCILGEDVEPCFEGASVTAPEVSKSFSLDNKFKATLYTMMQDLKNIASQGGQLMEKDNLKDMIEEEVVNTFSEQSVEDNSVTPEFAKKDEEKEDTSKKEDAGSEDKKEDASAKEDTPAKEDDTAKEDTPDETKKEDDEDKKKKTNHSLLETQYSELQARYSELETKYQELVEFKNSIEEAKKDELIESFYMLSEEDKKDVIENKAQYSYDDIEAKLSVICVRKKVSFDLEDSSNVEDDPIVTYSLVNDEGSVPAYVTALKNNRK